ncbi:MAG: hypothetical protein PWQ68_758 [Thermoanaerobacteraceae bacterium]|nr:hypothetical protein [Thermoanaerobacteraceae bacterium]
MKEHFSDIKHIWEELEKFEDITPFSTYTWADNWLKIWRKTAYILSVKVSGTIAGLAPFIDTMGKLRFIGYNNSDYLGFLFRPGHEQDFLEGLADELAGKNITLLDLEHMPEKFRDIKINGYEKSCFMQDVCPYITLPDSWDAYKAGLNKRFRKNIEYYWRRVNRDFNIKYEVVSKEQDVKPTLLRMVELHQKRWRSKRLPGAFYSKKIIQFHLNAAVDLFIKGYLDLHRLIINEEIAAVLYCFHKNRSTYYYIGGFDDAYKNMSIGVLLTSAAIKTSIERKDNIFDFLRGNESYKDNFCSEKRYNYRLVFHKGLLAGMRARVIEKGNSVIGAVKAHFES